MHVYMHVYMHFIHVILRLCNLYFRQQQCKFGYPHRFVEGSRIFAYYQREMYPVKSDPWRCIFHNFCVRFLYGIVSFLFVFCRWRIISISIWYQFILYCITAMQSSMNIHGKIEQHFVLPGTRILVHFNNAVVEVVSSLLQISTSF